ncbi:molecular chaperone [Salmonella enterica]|nr:molecular chaperone [Salmonella enterica]
MFFKSLSIQCVLVVMLSISFYSLASNKKGGIGLDATRVVLTSAKESASLRANNTSSNVFLLRAWITEYDSENTKDIPLFITPPLVRVNENESIQFRINKLSEVNSLPKDRESVFHINVMAIPPSVSKSKEHGKVELSLIHRIKLFYRPDALNNKKELKDIYKKIKVEKTIDGLRLNNPTPYYASMGNILVNNKSAPDDYSYMIPPFSEITVPYKQPVNSFGFQLIDDFGALTRPVNVIF